KFSFYALNSFSKKFSYLSFSYIILIGLLFTFLIYRLFRLTIKQVELSQQSARALEESVKARDEFFSIASHEFKTPLTSLKLQTQIFKRAMNRNDPKVTNFDFLGNVINILDGQILRIERLVD